MLVDSHCHLDYPDFAPEGVAEILSRARAAGVSHCLTICTQIADFNKIKAVAEQFSNVFCTIGTHPHHAAEEDEINVTADEIAALTQHPRVVGIGECGLDYYYKHSPPAEQQKVFAAHIEASLKSSLPLVIHTRDADIDTLSIMKNVGAGRARGVMHCFSGGIDLARASLDLGFYISFSGIITFKKADELREVVKFVPIDRMLVETDSPYLAPVPHRGKRNEPAYTLLTAEKAAEVKGIPFSELAEKTTENFFRLFSKAKPV